MTNYLKPLSEEEDKKFQKHFLLLSVAIFKNLPERLGSVELYNPQTNCFCTAGLALFNIGYPKGKLFVSTPDETSPYDVFKREFGFDTSQIGCRNDELVRNSPNRFDHKGDSYEYFGHTCYRYLGKSAPAKEVVVDLLNSIKLNPRVYMLELRDG